MCNVATDPDQGIFLTTFTISMSRSVTLRLVDSSTV